MEKYGKLPVDLGEIIVHPTEMMCYLYLPISMRDGRMWQIPERLEMYAPLVRKAAWDFEPDIPPKDFWHGYYVYLTVKTLFVTKDNPGNRPGVHSDGFGTEDINYIWYDTSPTVFYDQKFDIYPEINCGSVLKSLEAQAHDRFKVVYPCQHLLRLDQYCIHRSPDIDTPGIRTFVKVSISKERYNLEGNSHNYLFDYNWKMYPREEVRNHPAFKEADYFKQEEA